MDCHESNITWKLLGYFKELDYSKWIEQTFKHMEECIWSKDQTTIMQSNCNVWPQYCTETTSTRSESGEFLYYNNMMTLPKGCITIGLYTNSSCSTMVYQDKYATEEVLYPMENGQSASRIDSWEADNNDGGNNQYKGGNGNSTSWEMMVMLTP